MYLYLLTHHYRLIRMEKHKLSSFFKLSQLPEGDGLGSSSGLLGVPLEIASGLSSAP